MGRRKTGKDKSCLVCNKIFYVVGCEIKRGGGLYCSGECYKISKIKSVERFCLICKKRFLTRPLLIKIGRGIVCSRICADKKRSIDRKGKQPKQLSRLGKEPWNKGKKGVQVSWCKGKKLHYDIWNKGKKLPYTVWNKGKKFLAKEFNPRWKGGISQDKQHRKFLQKRWQFNNRERVAYHNKKRKSLMFNAGLLKVSVIQEIYEENILKYGYLTCEYCNKKINFGTDTIDHIKPLSKGGNNEKSNLCIACKSCNSKKKDKLEYIYQEKFG